MLWFTSDTHFGHANIIRYCNRPFASVGQMDEELIRRWNARVQPGDSVWHLGDFSMGAADTVQRYRSRLNGTVHLVWGNHDKRREEVAALFASVNDLAEITVSTRGENHHVVLCHYAMRVWPKSHHGAWQLYGHSHGTLPDDPHALGLDVGVDSWDYAPVSVAEIAARMAKKEWRPVDHHGRNKAIGE